MDHWEDHTCLRFTLRNSESDYVEYNNKQRSCYSYLGKIGGNQTVKTALPGVHFIVHEIGHAIGFWHDQSGLD